MAPLVHLFALRLTLSLLTLFGLAFLVTFNTKIENQYTRFIIIGSLFIAIKFLVINRIAKFPRANISDGTQR